MPLGAVYVGRGSIWGNPFIIGEPSGLSFDDGGDPTPMIAALSHEQVIEFYRRMVEGILSPEMHPHGHEWHYRMHKKCGGHPAEIARIFLKGKDLACWCELEEPCHADVLLELANR